MDISIENCAALRHEIYEKQITEILKHGKTGQKLSREVCFILNAYNVYEVACIQILIH